MATVMLSPHFSLAEMTYSQTASRMGLSNQPDLLAYENLKRLCGVLEKVRTICKDNAVTITSGYRNAEVNAAVGGSSTSAHMSGLAADFIIPGFGDPLQVCQAIEPHMVELGIDQNIWEYGDWTHMGLAIPPASPRCQCLTINNNGTTTGFA